MRFVGSGEKSRIWFTQVGDPLAHRLEGGTNRARSDRLVLLASKFVSVGEDEEVAYFGLLVRQSGEGSGVAVLLAEGLPDAEDLGLSLDSFDGFGSSGELQRSAEISLELISVGRCSSFQGVGCG